MNLLGTFSPPFGYLSGTFWVPHTATKQLKEKHLPANLFDFGGAER